MAIGNSTIKTVLKAGRTHDELTSLCRIKTYPDIGYESDPLETTDLEDSHDSFVGGVKSADSATFTANYVKSDFDAIKALEGQSLFYQLEMGENGEAGTFTWTGAHQVMVLGEGVNDVREMEITCILETAITFAAGTSILVTDDDSEVITSSDNPVELIQYIKL